MSKSFMDGVRAWNKKIYGNTNGTIKENGLNADDFWKEFRIKSWPKFCDSCASHIPPTWANEVREMLRIAQKELGQRIKFDQIKEKFCRLTVYYSPADKEAGQRMNELIEECKDKLIKKGVHPDDRREK